MPIVSNIEYRSMAAPLTAPTPSEGTARRFESTHYVEGVAARFDQPYEIYEFDGNKYYERIDPGALEGADLSDVILLFDHRGKPFARRSNGTLDLAVDSDGLRVYADLSRTEAARELYSEIGAGLITAMSWGFTIREHSYDKVSRTFTIRKIKKVYDVSAVTFPANPETSISARSLLDGVIEAERRSRRHNDARTSPGGIENLPATEVLARRRQLIKLKSIIGGI